MNKSLLEKSSIFCYDISKTKKEKQGGNKDNNELGFKRKWFIIKILLQIIFAKNKNIFLDIQKTR